MHVFKIACLSPAKQDLEVASKNTYNTENITEKNENTEAMEDKPGLRTVHRSTQDKWGNHQLRGLVPLSI